MKRMGVVPCLLLPKPLGGNRLAQVYKQRTKKEYALFLKALSEAYPTAEKIRLVQDNLSFLVNSAENPVLFTLLASISLLMFYWIWLNATGLKNAGERVSSSIGWTAALTIYLVLVVLGVVLALLFPSFIS